MLPLCGPDIGGKGKTMKRVMTTSMLIAFAGVLAYGLSIELDEPALACSCGGIESLDFPSVGQHWASTLTSLRSSFLESFVDLFLNAFSFGS